MRRPTHHFSPCVCILFAQTCMCLHTRRFRLGVSTCEGKLESFLTRHSPMADPWNGRPILSIWTLGCQAGCIKHFSAMLRVQMRRQVFDFKYHPAVCHVSNQLHPFASGGTAGVGGEHLANGHGFSCSLRRTYMELTRRCMRPTRYHR